MKLTCYVVEHRGLGGNIIIRLDNDAFVGLIYSLLVFFYLHVDVVPPVTTVLKVLDSSYRERMCLFLIIYLLLTSQSHVSTSPYISLKVL